MVSLIAVLPVDKKAQFCFGGFSRPTQQYGSYKYKATYMFCVILITLQSKHTFLTTFDLVYLSTLARLRTTPPLRRLNSAIIVLTVADVG
jgi:hypothetical protein